MNKEKYQFTGEVKNRVDGFKNHLQKQHIHPGTIRQKTNYTGYFLKWCETERLEAKDVRYNDLLTFIDYCRLNGRSIAHVNRMIASVRDYYNFLKEENPAILNPATGLYLKGTRHKIVSGICDFKELETLYQSYPTKTLREKRNKVILGMLVYQGITTEEISQLETVHLKIKEGKMDVPGNRKRNSRTLELKSVQILVVHEYITEVRVTLLKEITQGLTPGRKPMVIHQSRIDDQLFVSVNGSEHLKSSLLHLFRDVKKINPNVTSCAQIRQSVITHWLKTHNLREVQYMAGHKYVSSTERYQRSHLDNLQRKLEQHHPLNRKTVSPV